MVAQVDKNESTVVTSRIDPTSDGDGCFDMVGCLAS